MMGQGRLTPKPIAMIKHLISLLTDPGMTVLDPFVGSGTTLVACHEMSRECIAAEISAEHAAIARDRLVGSMRQLQLL